jgi:autophagy-related protein 2
VPNELTRIRLRIADGSIHVTPPTLSSRLVVSLAEARLSTNLMPDMPRTLATIELVGARALAVDSHGDLTEGNASSRTGCEYWKSRGFVQLLDLERSSIQARQGNGLIYPDFEVRSPLALSLVSRGAC